MELELSREIRPEYWKANSEKKRQKTLAIFTRDRLAATHTDVGTDKWRQYISVPGKQNKYLGLLSASECTGVSLFGHRHGLLERLNRLERRLA